MLSGKCSRSLEPRDVDKPAAALTRSGIIRARYSLDFMHLCAREKERERERAEQRTSVRLTRVRETKERLRSVDISMEIAWNESAGIVPRKKAEPYDDISRMTFPTMIVARWRVYARSESLGGPPKAIRISESREEMEERLERTLEKEWRNKLASENWISKLYPGSLDRPWCRARSPKTRAFPTETLSLARSLYQRDVLNG